METVQGEARVITHSPPNYTDIRWFRIWCSAVNGRTRTQIFNINDTTKTFLIFFFFISRQTLLSLFVAKFSAASVSVINSTAFMWHYDISNSWCIGSLFYILFGCLLVFKIDLISAAIIEMQIWKTTYYQWLEKKKIEYIISNLLWLTVDNMIFVGNFNPKCLKIHYTINV